MKKIVIVSAFLSPHRSGAESMVEEVSARLKDAYEITIVTCLSDSRLPRGLKRRDELPSGVRILRVGIGWGFDKWLFPLLGALAARRLDPDIVHAVLESYAGLALVMCRWLCPRAVRILTLQSTNTSLLLGPMHRVAHKITGISRALLDRARSFGRDDVTLIPNGIPLRKIDEACQSHQKITGRILFVGRLEPMKGVDTFLEAIATLLKREDATALPILSVHVVGGGSQRRSLMSRASALGIGDLLEFRGQLAEAVVLKEYAEAAIFCGLSRSEALGNVFLEAGAARCAVIATNVGGIPDIVKNGVNGLLVAPDDPQAAADALWKLLTDETLCKQLGEEGRKGKEGYDWEKITEQYRQIYESL